MSIYSTIVNYTYYDSKHSVEEKGIDKKKDYSYVSCWRLAKFNKKTSIYKF